MISSTTSVVSSTQPHGLGSISAVMLATLLGYAVLTICAGRFAPYGSPRSFMFAGIGGLIGSLLLSIASHLTLPTLPMAIMDIVGLAMFSPANALLLLMWGERWGTLAAGNVGRQLTLSFTFAFVLYFLVVAVPTPIAIVLNAAFPPLSALALRLSMDQPCRTEPVAPITPKASKMAAILASILLLSFAFGCMQHLVPISQGWERLQTLTMAASGLLVAFLAAWVTLRKLNGDPFTFYRPVVASMACGILLCYMVPTDLAFLGNATLLFGIYCLDMFMMFAASDLGYRARLPIALVFGAAIVAGRAGTYLGTQVGIWLITGPTASNPDHAMTIALGLACLVVLTGTIFFTATNLRSIYQPNAKPHMPNLDERCDQLARSAGLSGRELDVMRLLARGRSVAVIAETLGIAQGTVKHHASNTYRKLGVYDRQGLIDVVAGEAGEASAASRGRT